MKIPGLGKVHRGARWLRNQVDPRALILMYHRVADLPSDPFQLAVSPKHFAEHMAILHRHYRPMALRQLVSFLRGDRSPARPRGLTKLAATLSGPHFPCRTVVVTFDDGYQDNLVNAKPLMERWEVPGTVFVATGYVGKGREFWWDELERLVLGPGTLPQQGSLMIDGETLSWDLGDAARYTEADYQANRHWHGGLPQKPTPRQNLFLALHQRLRPLPEAQQRQTLDQLAAWTGSRTTRLTHRTMSAEEVRRLNEGELVEIGAHTMTHPVLAAQPPAVQQQEILQSKTGLEELLGHPVTSFAYPYGTVADYNRDTVAILRANGFTATCTTTVALTHRRHDPLQLPRAVIRDWDGDTFARHLQEHFRV